MALSYQANLVIEIPNINESYINSHIFTCQHWVSTLRIKIQVTLLGCSMIGQIVFNSGGLGANQNVSGKLGMKLAIGHGIDMSQIQHLPPPLPHTQGSFADSDFHEC